MDTRLGFNKASEHDSKQYVHMLNATLTATERTMCCILENYVTPEGVRVPEVLQPFCGTDFFKFTREKPVNKNKINIENAAKKKEEAK